MMISFVYMETSVRFFNSSCSPRQIHLVSFSFVLAPTHCASWPSTKSCIQWQMFEKRHRILLWIEVQVAFMWKCESSLSCPVDRHEKDAPTVPRDMMLFFDGPASLAAFTSRGPADLDIILFQIQMVLSGLDMMGIYLKQLKKVRYKSRHLCGKSAPKASKLRFR